MVFGGLIVAAATSVAATAASGCTKLYHSAKMGASKHVSFAKVRQAEAEEIVAREKTKQLEYWERIECEKTRQKSHEFAHRERMLALSRRRMTAVGRYSVVFTLIICGSAVLWKYGYYAGVDGIQSDSFVFSKENLTQSALFSGWIKNSEESST